jgi:hypothetical protein
MSIEDAVYQTLTKQYELAKVDEAKELPLAKVLDAPAIPERKSFPHRGLIALGGGVLAGIFAILYVFVRRYWEITPDEAPWKALVFRLRRGKPLPVPADSMAGGGK